MHKSKPIPAEAGMGFVMNVKALGSGNLIG
jgi:hypothetical protein